METVRTMPGNGPGGGLKHRLTKRQDVSAEVPPGSELKRTMGMWQLTLLSVGATLAATSCSPGSPPART
ncbi:hypothetical protein OHT52_12500 [Streptomyces sp. NBC_00247]|uniref:hypothetical protein n=1 Tax=Streptomyces sp. NBC_00247 TaxID=2975689 RepID=UPI002E2D6F72|nr:hypothetical protein [Streptomyces sp. NBC_00247]